MSQAIPSRPLSVETTYREESFGNFRSLALWGYTNFFITLFFMVFGVFTSGVDSLLDVNNLTKFVYFSMLLFLVVAHTVGRIPVRIAAPFLILLILQLWYCFTSLYAAEKMGRDMPFSTSFYDPLGVVLCYLNGAALVYIVPQARRWVINSLCVTIGFSALVALGQLAGIGPAVDLGNKYVAWTQITNFLVDVDTVRAPGSLPFGSSVTIGMTMFVFIMVGLKFGKLKKGLLAFAGLIFVAAVAPQIRGMLPLIGLGGAVGVYYIFQRYRKKAIIPMVILVVLATAFVVRFPDKFAYYGDFFSGQNTAGTFDFRADKLWPQATSVYQVSPWVGIGVEPRFTGFPGPSDNFVGFGLMESGYYFALACGGIPALVLTCMFLVAMAASPFAEIRRGVLNDERYRLLIALGVLGLSIPLWFATGNFYHIAILPMMGLAGVAMADREEQNELSARRLFRRYGRVRSKA